MKEKIRRKSERKEGKCGEGRRGRGEEGHQSKGEKEAMAAVWLLFGDTKAMQTCLF